MRVNTLFEDDSGSNNLEHSHSTRFTLFENDPGSKSLRHSHSTRSMLFNDQDSGASTRSTFNQDFRKPVQFYTHLLIIDDYIRRFNETTKTQLKKYTVENPRDSWMSNKDYFDNHKRLRGVNTQLQVGDLVLRHSTKSRFSRSRQGKLDDNWNGPFRIREIPENSTYYVLEELDGTPLAVTIAGNRLKKFFSRSLLEEERMKLDIRDEEDEGSMNGNENDE